MQPSCTSNCTCLCAATRGCTPLAAVVNFTSDVNFCCRILSAVAPTCYAERYNKKKYPFLSFAKSAAASFFTQVDHPVCADRGARTTTLQVLIVEHD